MNRHPFEYIRELTDLISEYLDYLSMFNFHKYLNIPMSLKFIDKIFAQAKGAILCDSSTHSDYHNCKNCGKYICDDCLNISKMDWHYRFTDITTCRACDKECCVFCCKFLPDDDTPYCEECRDKELKKNE